MFRKHISSLFYRNLKILPKKVGQPMVLYQLSLLPVGRYLGDTVGSFCPFFNLLAKSMGVLQREMDHKIVHHHAPTPWCNIDVLCSKYSIQ